MARRGTNVERNTFIRGLVTEAGPLTFPENASKDELNFVLNKDGSRQRRLGMEYEVDYELVDTGIATADLNDSFLSSFRWDNVGNDADTSIGVVQVSNKLYFFDMAADATSANLLNSGNPITISVLTDLPFSFAAVNGVLVVVGEGINNPVFLEYNGTTDTVTQEDITIEVRDIWGVYEDVAVTARPGTLTDLHQYNIRNQGWDNTKISAFFTSQSNYPSLADVWFLGKDANDDFDPALMVKQEFGTTRAARGRFIIDAFNRGAERESATGLTTLPDDLETGNISTIASFAGRVFYSGVRGNLTDGDKSSPQFSGTIFFTQIVDNNQKLGHCYQAGDPSSEFSAEVVANDGGTLQIPEAAGILKLLPKEDSLLVFAENGVWLISGGDGSFTADNFFVRKITNVGAEGPESIVDVDGTVLYWAKGGIYQLVPDPRSGRLVAQNITERTIQTAYSELSSIAKKFAKGVFDSPTRRVKWLYNDEATYDGSSRINRYNKELTLDFVLGAFYIQDIKTETGSPYVSGYLQTSDFVIQDVEELVVVGNDVVQVNGENVVVINPTRSRGNTVIKYLTVVPGTTDSITFSSFRQSEFLDWKIWNSTGIDAAGFLLTGEELFGDTQRDKQVSYFTAHFLRTEEGFEFDDSNNLVPINPSSCNVQARWDFSDTANSGKFGNSFEAYRLTRPYISSGIGDEFDYGQEVITTKTKLRGSGRALSVYFTTSPGKDLYLYGWAMVADGNTVV